MRFKGLVCASLFAHCALFAVPSSALECSASRTLITRPEAASPATGFISAQLASPPLAEFSTYRGELWFVDGLEADVVASSPLAGPPTRLDVMLYVDQGGGAGTQVCGVRGLVPKVLSTGGAPGWRVRAELPDACTLCAGQRYWLSILARGPGEAYQWRSRDPGSSDRPFALTGRSLERGPVKGDFNGDLCPDLVLQEKQVRNGASRVKLWWMNGAVKIGESSLPRVRQPWQVVAAGFGVEENTVTSNALTLQNPRTGEVRIWRLQDLAVVEEQVIVAAPEHGEAYPKSDRRVVAQDLLLSAQRSPDGSANHVCMGQGGGMIIWNQSQATAGEVQAIPYPGGAQPEPARVSVPGLDLRGVADLSGDDYPDFIFQRVGTGEVSTWRMSLETAPNGDPQPTRVADGALAPQPAPALRLTAVGDFGVGPAAGSVGPALLCGAQDLVFQNAGSGEIVIWHLNHDLERTGETRLSTPGPGWVLVAPR